MLFKLLSTLTCSCIKMARITSNELETTPIIMENIFLIVTWLPLHIIVKETDSGEKRHWVSYAFVCFPTQNIIAYSRLCFLYFWADRKHIFKCCPNFCFGFYSFSIFDKQCFRFCFRAFKLPKNYMHGNL